jgi:TonB family protein
MAHCWRFLAPLLLAATIGGCATASGATTEAAVSAEKRKQQTGIDFDSKGVDFRPWLAEFIARVRKQWNIPVLAMHRKGHVVVTFNVHKDGSITDVTVRRPSREDSFNKSAYNAVAASNPVGPLPSAYPEEHAFFTLTFFFNEAQKR